jgi:hypothetical protein
MPTHFHFLVYVKTDQVELLKKKVGLLLSSYTKAINVRYGRHGSLFQEHTKSKRVDKDRYLLKLVTYIHQNPIRAEIAKHLEDWEFSSYRDYSGMRNGTLVRKETIQSYFLSVKDFMNRWRPPLRWSPSHLSNSDDDEERRVYSGVGESLRHCAAADYYKRRD